MIRQIGNNGLMECHMPPNLYVKDTRVLSDRQHPLIWRAILLGTMAILGKDHEMTCHWCATHGMDTRPCYMVTVFDAIQGRDCGKSR